MAHARVIARREATGFLCGPRAARVVEQGQIIRIPNLLLREPKVAGKPYREQGIFEGRLRRHSMREGAGQAKGTEHLRKAKPFTDPPPLRGDHAVTIRRNRETEPVTSGA